MSEIAMKLPLHPATDAEAEDWGGVDYDGDGPVVRWARIADTGGTVVAYTVSVQDEWDGDDAQKRRDAIIRAVNSHDELVAALREARGMVRACCAVSGPEDTSDLVASWNEKLAQIDAALAKAGGTDA